MRRAAGVSFWSYYVLRHWLGPRYGDYGPPWGRAFLERIEAELLRHHQRARTPTRLAQAVPEVDGREFRPEQFRRSFLAENRPVVLRGLARDWVATQSWSPEYFARHYGVERVPVRLRGDQHSNTQIADCTIADLVRNLRGGGTRFGANLEDIFNRNPELREALDIAELTRFACAHARSKIGSTQLFMSGAGARSAFHCTGGINLFVQIYGRKEWTFVAPEYSLSMYPVTRRDMFYAASHLDWKKTFDALDREGFPLYRYVPKLVTMLEPGDVLFSPQWWWHAVDTPEPAIGVATRAMNSFFVGNKVFAALWLSSGEFRRLLWHLIRNGWGSDASSGARLAYEAAFVDEVTR
jgi:hypothetical protein